MGDTLAVATWTLRQIDQASGLRAECFLDGSYATDPAAEEACRYKLFRHLANLAHPLAIELDPRDIEFRRTKDEGDPRYGETIHARWNPSTKTCEMRGGQEDGVVIEHSRPGESIRFPYRESWSLASLHADATGPEVSPPHPRYDLAGWSETHRRWVYEVA